MSKDEAKDQLIQLLFTQVVDLVMMSKIELGNDVITEIKRLKEDIKVLLYEYSQKRSKRNG